MRENACLPDERLAQWVDRRLSPLHLEACYEHVLRCESCRRSFLESVRFVRARRLCDTAERGEERARERRREWTRWKPSSR